MSVAYRVLVADQIALDGLAPLRDDPRFDDRQAEPQRQRSGGRDRLGGSGAGAKRDVTRDLARANGEGDRARRRERGHVGVEAATELGIAGRQHHFGG
jgi:hypothetical protein